MRFVAAAALASAFTITTLARGEPTGLAARLVGAPAVEAIASSGRRPFVLVAVPDAVDARALGLLPVVRGVAVLSGDAFEIASFAKAHPTLRLDLAPPLRPKLDLARSFVGAAPAQIGTSLDGSGVVVGVVDTGIDVFHPDFRTDDGKTRIAWFLDYKRKPRKGNALEEQYGARIYDRTDLDALLSGAATADLPGDDDGHGTHVAGIAAGNGGSNKRFVGVAPNAEVIAVRAADETGAIDEGRAVMGAKFVFDRAKEMGRPAAVNLSLGTQFGAHDGTSLFERALVALAQGPGRAVVVAASNEGHLAIHTGVRVAKGATYRIPVRLPGTDGRGRDYADAQVFVWINARDRGPLKVRVLGPTGDPWSEAIGNGQGATTNPVGNVRVTVANDDPRWLEGGDTRGAIVVLSGALPAGIVELELEGDTAVEMWLQGAKQASDGEPGAPSFPRGGLVEGTVGVPASAAGLIAIGAVDARVQLKNRLLQVLTIPNAAIGTRSFFSSAGPSAAGAMRPDVLAPGYYVVSSMARSAFLAAPRGTFSEEVIIDSEHAALAGTSMSAPFGAGAAALLFQRDPTLTQEDVRAALQAGARPLVDDPTGGGSVRDHAKGSGILDVAGALAAIDRRGKAPRATKLRARYGAQWIAADGQLPVAVLAIATDDAGRPADVEGGLSVQLDGATLRSNVEHPMPGLYRFSIVAAAGRGGTRATIALQGGGLLVRHELPVGADRWDAIHGRRAGGGCTFAGAPGSGTMLAGLIVTALCRRRLRTRALARAARRDGTGASDLPR